jgi:eukaryotic-like serine/threonine-protein kinase
MRDGAVAARDLATTDSTYGVGVATTVQNTGAEGVSPGEELSRGTAIRRYVVLERLGAGGMGVVYAAYDYGLDRRIALKLVRDRGGEAARARLVREAQALAKLSHPNVVTVYDVGEHDGEVYVAMELVEGSSLRAWLAAKPRDWRAVLEVFRRAGAGLAAAHAAGIVHRDVKPDNIFIDGGGAVRVGDFGLARIDQDSVTTGEVTPHSGGAAMTLTGTVMGTPPYMSPEQHAGRREIDARTDQFGFCVALYEALYGARPFAGDDSAALCAAIAAGRLTAPETGREVPGWIRRAIVRGLAADPAARFPSMTALLVELGRDPRVRRRRWVIAGAALTAMAGIALGSAWLAGGDAAAACRVDGARFAGVWDAPRRAAMHAAFVRSGAPGAEDAWQRVERAIDERTAGWQRMHTEACEATHVRAEQSPELLDLRMACLDDRATDLRAVTDLLVDANRAMVKRAFDAIRGLEPLDACTRPAALRAGGHRATDAGAAERRDRLSRARAATLLGKRPLALEILRTVANDARAVHDSEVESRAMRSAGDLLTERGEVEGAQDALYRALSATVANDSQELATRAWLSLAWLVGVEGGRHDEAHQLARVARATLERLGSAPALQANLEDLVGVLFYNQGKYAEAAPHLERGLALREQVHGPTSREVASSLQHLGLLRGAEGRKELALELHRRARENAEREIGPNYAPVIAYVGAEGAALFELGRYDEALALFERALEAVRRSDPDDALQAAGMINNIAMVQYKRGELVEAQASYERSLALFEPVTGRDSTQIIPPLFNLGAVLRDRGRYDESLAHLQRAVGIQETVLGKEHPELADTLSEVGTTLLAAHRPGLAIAPLERAIAIRAHLAGAVKEVAEDRLLLARALVDARRERGRALELADAARAVFVAQGDAASVKSVDSWRAEVGRRARR